MSLDTTLARAARSEQRLWRSQCTITRPGPGPRVLDPVTLQYSTPPVGVVYAGICQVRPMRRDRDEEVQVGEEAVALALYVVKVPTDTPAQRDDTVLVTATNDPALIGRTLAVKEIPMGDWTACRRLVCEVITVAEPDVFAGPGGFGGF